MQTFRPITALLAAILLVAVTGCTSPTPAASTPTSAATPTVAPAPATAPKTAADSTATPASAPKSAAAPTTAAVPTAAATTTASPGSASAGAGLAPCIMGEWEIDNLQQYFSDTFAMLIPAGSGITLGDAEGTARYRFQPDGTAISTLDMKIAATATGGVNVVVGMKGESGVRHRLEDRELVFSDQTLDGVLLSITVNGIAVAPPSAVSSWIPDGATQSRMRVGCTGNTLELTTTVPIELPTVRLRRV